MNKCIPFIIKIYYLYSFQHHILYFLFYFIALFFLCSMYLFALLCVGWVANYALEAFFPVLGNFNVLCLKHYFVHLLFYFLDIRDNDWLIYLQFFFSNIQLYCYNCSSNAYSMPEIILNPQLFSLSEMDNPFRFLTIRHEIKSIFLHNCPALLPTFTVIVFLLCHFIHITYWNYDSKRCFFLKANCYFRLTSYSDCSTSIQLRLSFNSYFKVDL